MTAHPMLPGVVLQPGFIHPAFERYLREWRELAIVDADQGLVTASACQQAALIDLVLEGRIRHDWLSIMDEFLMDEMRPTAYSAGFGKRLHKFEGQYLQSTVHSIYTRWWIEMLCKPSGVNHGLFAELIISKKQTDGLIYDRDTSETILRHRMKAELTMSAAMGSEILCIANRLSESLRDELSTNLCDPNKVPPLGYMTCEQFRLSALRTLDREEQFPVGIGGHIDACAEGLEYGWCDFSMASKVDAYMGTAKRTTRDKPINSPLVACHVNALRTKVNDPMQCRAISDRLVTYSRWLSENPLDIPAFQMRDVPIAFGTDISPIEAICASWLITSLNLE